MALDLVYKALIDSDSAGYIPVSTEEVTAVVGRPVLLPCDTICGLNDDRVYMVLVFKQPIGRPIFRYVSNDVFKLAHFI